MKHRGVIIVRVMYGSMYVYILPIKITSIIFTNSKIFKKLKKYKKKLKRKELSKCT